MDVDSKIALLVSRNTERFGNTHILQIFTKHNFLLISMAEKIAALKRLLALTNDGPNRELTSYDEIFTHLNAATEVPKPATRQAHDPTTKAHELFAVVKSLVTLIVAQEEEIEALKRKVLDIERKEPASAPPLALFSSVIAEKGSERQKAEANYIIAAAKETREHDRRSRNVVLFGVKESTSENSQMRSEEDGEVVGEIFAELGVERTSIKRVFRVGRGGSSRPGPVVVELKEASSDREADPKSTLLKSCRNLRNSTNPDFKKVFIAPDMTVAEREVYSRLVKLRDQKNAELRDPVTKRITGSKYYGIRDFKLVELKLVNRS